MKAHFYPFTGQVTPVALDLLVCLGVPASAVDALRSVFDAKTLDKEAAAPGNDRPAAKGGSRG
ncbi:hypothetical protein HFN89_03320 [Rhizobium laguerreae]|nr:hypothetical protein [Rhizobium laguerreae]